MCFPSGSRGTTRRLFHSVPKIGCATPDVHLWTLDDARYVDVWVIRACTCVCVEFFVSKKEEKKKKMGKKSFNGVTRGFRNSKKDL